jgi:hypothetical protein
LDERIDDTKVLPRHCTQLVDVKQQTKHFIEATFK